MFLFINQRSVSTAKRLASLFWYLIASTIDTLHNTINGNKIWCIWNSKYNVHVCMIQTNVDFVFQKLFFCFLLTLNCENLANNCCRLQFSRIDICPSCFVYDLSNTIFRPIGSALTKHPVASQKYTLTA